MRVLDLTSYQDNQCVGNCDDPNSSNHRLFEQPVIQTAQMFIGEIGCWLVVGLISLYQVLSARYRGADGPNYEIIQPADGDTGDSSEQNVHSSSPSNLREAESGPTQLQGFKIAILGLPALCDVCGTTLMHIGLLFVVPSIYQMTRGMLVIWVGILSVIFLKKRLYLFQWSALVTVVLGVSLVGLAGALFNGDGREAALEAAKDSADLMARAVRSPDTLHTILGVSLIGGAQIFTATQFVFEEFILEKYELAPLKVVGWEGIFGLAGTTLGMLVLHLTIGRTAAGHHGYFDAVEGLKEVTSYRSIAVSSVLIMISIG